MEKAYGPQQDNLIKKITGKAVQGDKDLILHFKNEKHPKIVVTVDLLTTGIDVEEITRLVFMRRVKSRILYEQMVGRATRLCPDLYGEGEHKTNFEIFDAVDLYSALLGFSNMKPVVQNPNASISETVGFLQQAADAGNTEAAEAFHRELMVKVRRRRALIEKAQEALALKFEGLTPATLLSDLSQSPAEALTLLSVHPELADWITSLRQGDGRRRQLISDHEDSIQEPTHRGYGKGNEKPTDYLKSFGAWIDDNKSKIEALSLVLTSPSSLTRVELKKLILAMDQDGFVESHLREAWREAKSENCAARLIGYIRTQSLGSPLIPFDDRVDQAVDRIMATTNFMWTQNQRRWLERIAKQVKKEILVDKDAFKAGAFSSMGGFSTVNKSFSGRLEELLTTFHEQIWEDSA
jgi:type I restriction enzyme R subunit